MDRRCGPRSRKNVASLLAALILLGIVLVAILPSDAHALSPPAAPKDLEAVPGDAQVSLRWKEPKAAGEYKIDYYVVYQDGVDVKHSAKASTSAVIAGLTNGRTYSFAVAAHNSAGVGEMTSVVRSTPRGTSTAPEPAAVPGPPTDLRATAGDTVVTLSWSAPGSDGKAIDHYIVYRDGVDAMHVTTNEATISGLTNGRAYEFTVAAHNPAGTGPSSAPAIATPSAALPSPGEVLEAPTSLRATPGDGTVTLSWNAPSGAVDQYIVYQDGVEVMRVAGTSATVTGLINGETYSYTVVARGPDGAGPASAMIAASPAREAVEDADNTALMAGMLVLIGAAGAVALLLMNRTRARRPN